MTDSIALLVLATSNKRDEWKNIKDTYLYNMTLKTFLLTQDKEYNYKIYIGIDRGDRIFDDKNQQHEILKFSSVFKNIKFEFVYFNNKNIPKGYCTVMWNILFQKAYDENYDYFYQCGDDMLFLTKGWVSDCVKTLKEHNDIGLTGPINNNDLILTQSFVSRKHMEIFGWYFPEVIKNWFCDDWYNIVYQPNYLYKLEDHFVRNSGGTPRYNINNDNNFDNEKYNNLKNEVELLAIKHKSLIVNYLSKIFVCSPT